MYKSYKNQNPNITDSALVSNLPLFHWSLMYFPGNYGHPFGPGVLSKPPNNTLTEINKPSSLNLTLKIGG